MKIPVKCGLVELNNAPEEVLDRDVGLGPERAQRIVEHRPFRAWDEVTRVEGITVAIVAALVQAGVELGDPATAELFTVSEQHRRMLLSQHAGRVDVFEGVPAEGRRAPLTRRS